MQSIAVAVVYLGLASFYVTWYLVLLTIQVLRKRPLSMPV